jgi:hypothetical protein
VQSNPREARSRKGGVLSELPLLAVGEVHTALLQNSHALAQRFAEELIAGPGGGPVRRSLRPITHIGSPEVLEGVDCQLPTRSGARCRGVGTVAGRVSLTGGHILQASVRAGLSSAPLSRRQGWSHYLARPGQLEIIGKGKAQDLADGFVAERLGSGALDLGSVAARLLAGLQRSILLDHRAPLKAVRTSLRWVALPVTEPTQVGVRFAIEKGGLRTLMVRCRPGDLHSVGDFCDDVALHEWLLGTLLQLVEDGYRGAGDDQIRVGRLRPGVQHLLHLWMPRARLTGALAELWRGLDDRPGLTRQWSSCVDRIRDQLALSTLDLLARTLGDP